MTRTLTQSLTRPLFLTALVLSVACGTDPSSDVGATQDALAGGADDTVIDPLMSPGSQTDDAIGGIDVTPGGAGGPDQPIEGGGEDAGSPVDGGSDIDDGGDINGGDVDMGDVPLIGDEEDEENDVGGEDGSERGDRREDGDGDLDDTSEDDGTASDDGGGVVVDTEGDGGPDGDEEVAEDAAEAGADACNRGRGFWRNHPEAWAGTVVTLGDRTYTQDEALDLLATPARGDASLILGAQLIAAELNIDAGAAWSDIESTVDAAHELLGAEDDAQALPLGIQASTTPGGQAVDLGSVLDAWNNGDCDAD